jgi:hypothetical protein
MGGELLQPAPGMLVLRLDGGRPALFGLLVEETHLVHGAAKPRIGQGSPFLSGHRRRAQALPHSQF